MNTYYAFKEKWDSPIEDGHMLYISSVSSHSKSDNDGWAQGAD